MLQGLNLGGFQELIIKDYKAYSNSSLRIPKALVAMGTEEAP